MWYPFYVQWKPAGAHGYNVCSRVAYREVAMALESRLEFRIEPRSKARARQAARRRGVSMSELIRVALEREVERENVER